MRDSFDSSPVTALYLLPFLPRFFLSAPRFASFHPFALSRSGVCSAGATGASRHGQGEKKWNGEKNIRMRGMGGDTDGEETTGEVG